jgi:hypothetical protein
MLAVILAVSLAGAPAGSYSLVVEGKTIGEFQEMSPGGRDGAGLSLRDGWVNAGVLEAWWNELEGSEAPLATGENSRTGPCPGRKVSVVQRFGHGMRQRQRSWTIMDACPVEWTVEEQDAARLVTSLIAFEGTRMGVER